MHDGSLMESFSGPATLRSQYRDSSTKLNIETLVRGSISRLWHKDKYRDSGTRLNIETLARGSISRLGIAIRHQFPVGSGQIPIDPTGSDGIRPDWTHQIYFAFSFQNQLYKR
ncbi:hypothetical protein AVEN_61915-1 [Araneus ventricosus]|uniref:Uncharacterized protein n=1 Tax=Araneus ventricosus TaxID=182803 RepID=A0A4Y2UBG5_ARAVE|nr:hypothetical protein AVEN_61915-1 [Araneus ventricosus]